MCLLVGFDCLWFCVESEAGREETCSTGDSRCIVFGPKLFICSSIHMQFIPIKFKIWRCQQNQQQTAKPSLHSQAHLLHMCYIQLYLYADYMRSSIIVESIDLISKSNNNKHPSPAPPSHSLQRRGCQVDEWWQRAPVRATRDVPSSDPSSCPFHEQTAWHCLLHSAGS
jgi:hypothetical protein